MRIVFVTGTRADWGKMRPLVEAAMAAQHDVTVWVTGMHCREEYGYTQVEVRSGLRAHRIHTAKNACGGDLASVLHSTTMLFAAHICDVNPDLVVVHGDRTEALACAFAAASANVRVAHIEGGELSGTIDGSIRHAVSKLAHIHLATNEKAAGRLRRMGENPAHIHVIGSPDIDVIRDPNRMSLREVRDRYDLPWIWGKFGVLSWHPVTTELDTLAEQTEELLSAAVRQPLPWVVIEPNSDPGSEVIRAALREIEGHSWKVFPSVRFEAMLRLLEHASVCLGNSSMGICEAPYFGTPTVNVGSRQDGRSDNPHILHVPAERHAIAAALTQALQGRVPAETIERGDGTSADRFLQVLETAMDVPIQKRWCE